MYTFNEKLFIGSENTAQNKTCMLDVEMRRKKNKRNVLILYSAARRHFTYFILTFIAEFIYHVD